MFIHDPTTPLDADIGYREWTRVAEARLREHWPTADAKSLEGIAIELFNDPYRGTLAPRQAVEEWMLPWRGPLIPGGGVRCRTYVLRIAV